MDGARRKELKDQYRQAKTEMGVYAYRCNAQNRVYIGASQNLPGTLNSIRFQLEQGSFPTNQRLMEDWRQYGPEGFAVETLETLEYDKDNDAKTDYREDLAILKDFWREELTRGGAAVENIRPKDR